MRQDTELLKSIADQAAEILTLRECVVTLKREVAALEAERDALRRVVAAADAMRDMGVSIGQQVVHPEGMPDDRALYEFIGLFDGPFQRDYDAARAALKEGK